MALSKEIIHFPLHLLAGDLSVLCDVNVPKDKSGSGKWGSPACRSKKSDLNGTERVAFYRRWHHAGKKYDSGLTPVVDQAAGEHIRKFTIGYID